MKKLFTTLFVGLLIVGFTNITVAQNNMKSPPATLKSKIGGAGVEVKYSQPAARDREIMGGLVPYGEVWRTGANAATTISFDKDVEIEGEMLAKGMYSIYSIPGEESWTIIFNSATGQWGTQYPEDKDALRVEVPSGDTDEFVESFTISDDGDHLIFAWENTQVAVEIASAE